VGYAAGRREDGQRSIGTFSEAVKGLTFRMYAWRRTFFGRPRSFMYRMIPEDGTGRPGTVVEAPTAHSTRVPVGVPAVQLIPVVQTTAIRRASSGAAVHSRIFFAQ
jgi:hypothetical protein